MSMNIIGIKTNLVSAIESLKVKLLLILSEDSYYPLNENRKEVADMVWKIIYVSKYMDILEKEIPKYTKSDILSLTLNNLFNSHK